MQAREAFETVCVSIAKEYEKKGWKYLKSTHKMKLVTDELVFLVTFHSSCRNISGVNVDFEGNFCVDPRKKKYQCTRYLGVDTNRYWIPKSGYPMWNVADEEGRKSAIQEFLGWSEEVVFPFVDAYLSNKAEFVKKVAYEGFPMHVKEFITDVEFVLLQGSRELAEVAAKQYYESLDEDIKESFRTDYEWLMAGNEKPITSFGKNMLVNHSNFRTIMENRISMNFDQ